MNTMNNNFVNVAYRQYIVLASGMKLELLYNLCVKAITVVLNCVVLYL